MVDDARHLVGILTEADLVRYAAEVVGELDELAGQLDPLAHH